MKIEYVAGGVRVKSNRVTSNAKSGILLWKSKVSEVSGNRAEKNRGNGVYAYASVIPVMKKNTFCENGKVQAVYVKSCKGWTGINRLMQSCYIKKYSYKRNCIRQPDSYCICAAFRKTDKAGCIIRKQKETVRY